MAANGLPDSVGINGPADIRAVTPSDTVNMPLRARIIYVGVTGDLAVLAADDATSVVFKAVPAGAWFIVGIPGTIRVMATGTTATNLVAGK